MRSEPDSMVLRRLIDILAYSEATDPSGTWKGVCGGGGAPDIVKLVLYAGFLTELLLVFWEKGRCVADKKSQGFAKPLH